MIVLPSLQDPQLIELLGKGAVGILPSDTIYGLAGGVFTSDTAKGMRVLQKLRAGITWLNTYHPTFNEAPWGGYKQSGIGRELGTYGLDAYLETKQININLNPQRLGWFSRL